MELYQVLNNCGDPASAHESCENLALFWSWDKAEQWLLYLKKEYDEPCTINIIRNMTQIKAG